MNEAEYRRGIGAAFGYPAFRTAAWLSRHLPLSASRGLACVLADVLRVMDLRGRTGVACNLRRIAAHRGEAPSDAELARFVRSTYRNFGVYLVEFFRSSMGHCSDLDARLDIEGMEEFRAALGGGRGVILVTAHLGNWELGGLALGRLGHQISAAYRPYADPRLDRLFTLQRMGRGIRLFPLGGSVRGLLRALRQAETVALLADRDFTRHHCRARFFGHEALLPAGPARLSLRTGAPLLPAFLTRRPGGRYRLRFDPMIDPCGSGMDDERLQEGITLAMERAVGDDPDQWFVFRDFWGTSDPAAERRSRGSVGGAA